MSNNGIAVITGASTGLGAIYADRLASRGLDLILVARDADRMRTLADRLRSGTGVDVRIVAADLATDDGVGAVEAELGGNEAIALLVNNAGMSLNGSVLDNGPVELNRIIALNVTAPTRLASAAAKAFAARDGGSIINIASVLALAPENFDGVYSGTKAYMLNLSLAMNAQLRERNVYVQAVLPGATRTEIWERSGKDVDNLPPGIEVMEAGDLVDAALVGFDRREAVTIPPLPDAGQWTTLQEARLAMGPNLSKRKPAERYLETAAA